MPKKLLKSIQKAHVNSKGIQGNTSAIRKKGIKKPQENLEYSQPITKKELNRGYYRRF